MHTLLLLGLVASTSGLLDIFFHNFRSNCTFDEFECRNGRCIASELHCNDRDDCHDQSDEKDCDWYLCKEETYFKCKNGRCISKMFLCNEEDDCSDYSDEVNCDSFKIAEHVNSTCEAGHWQCTDKLCIPKEWVCDGENHCLDNSDEGIGCSSNIDCETFKCKNGHCIPNEWICDGRDDCHDKSDEENCENHIPVTECNLDNNKFLCSNNKTCIDRDKVCNGHADCPDKSDESPLCTLVTTSCSTHGCSHQCIQLPTGPKCVCPIGYHNEGEKQCKDINECEEYGICDQKCRNTPGSYECYCERGYILKEDKKTCKVARAEGLLIFSSRREIRGLHLHSEIYIPLATDLQQAIGVDYDGEHVYWTEVVSEHESIVRSDGSNHEVLVTSGLGTPEDIAIDWLTGNMYFTDAEYKHIGVCTRDGSHCTVLLNRDIRKPRGIVLDVGKGKMYWSDWAKPAEIAVSYMDGSNDESFLTSDLQWPNGLAIDFPNGRLYWTDAKKMSIESIRLDGTGRRVVLNGIVMHPYAIAIFENKLYWSDWHTKSIESCNKFTGKEHHTMVKVQHGQLIYDLHVYHSVLHQRTTNPCSTAYCSDICLLKGDNDYTCACPENKMLSSDGHTCKDTGSKRFVIVGAKNLLYHIEHQLLGKQDITSLPTKAEDIISLAYDSVHNVVYISDFSVRKIISLNLYTGISRPLDITGLGKISAMDYDAMGNNLYICDEEKKILEVINLNTLSRKILLHDMNNDVPESIALIPEEGVMFVALRNVDESEAHVDRFNMDGTGRIHSKLEDLKGPISLHYDYDLHRIFISDADRGVIESTSVEGDDCLNFRTLTSNPTEVTTLKEHLFWVNQDSKRLYWADKKSLSEVNKVITMDLPDDIEKLHLTSVMGKSFLSNQCSVNNNNCSHLCLMSQKAVVCACPTGWNLLPDMHTCTKRIHCEITDYFCSKSNSCILKSLRCNGHKDCEHGEDEEECETKSKCSEGQFQCQNGECIKNEKVCDHNFDCTDKSDEQHCNEMNRTSGCSSEEFTCQNGKCIPMNFRCDGHDDCEDSSDEDQCKSSDCLESQFRCESGTCIPKSWECDQEFDCPDFSDEHELCSTVTCPPTAFTCSNGKCIDRKLICDNVDDCGDNSDEHTCFIKALGNCELDEFPCSSNSSICLHNSASCNGIKECPQGEDEENCSTCVEMEYMCDNRKCIPIQWVCDGIDDCGDKSDEQEDCHNKNHTITSTAAPLTYETCEDGFRCKSGQCIQQDVVCDGRFDCYDGSDEGGRCTDACNQRKNPCSQNCHSTPIGPTCSCHFGFQLKGDGFTCIDQNECEYEPPVCSQLCHNTEGSYKCDCYDGFLLRNDRKSCKAEGDPMSLIFSTEGQIRELIQKTNELKIIFSAPTPKIASLDSSFDPKYIYFSLEQPPSIHQINLDNKKRNYIMNKDIGQPKKIAIDWSTHNIYYYNAVPGEKAIKMCNFKDASCANVINIDTHRHVSVMTIDSVNKLLFYALSNWWMFNSPSFIICKVNLDGNNNEIIVNTSAGYITGLTFDHNKKHLYFMNEHSGQINKLNYEGKQNTVLYSNVTRSVGLKFFENHLYYFTTGGFMTKCRLYDKPRCHNFKVHSSSSDQFTILHKSLQPKLENVCKNHTCTYTCLPSGSSYRCSCNDGTLRHKNEKCENSKTITMVEKLRIHSVSLEEPISSNHSGTTALAIVIPLLLVGIGVFACYVIKKKNKGRLNISMRFHNPAYQGKADDGQPILQPGLHEYTNPVHSKHSDSELIFDAKNLNEPEHV